MKRRISPELRRKELFESAIGLAEGGNLYDMSVHQIAKRCDCSRPHFYNHFDNITALRDAVIKFAMHSSNVSILAQALTASDPRVKDITPEQRTLVSEWINT